MGIFGRKNAEEESRMAVEDFIKQEAERETASDLVPPSMVEVPHQFDHRFRSDLENALRVVQPLPLDDLARILRTLTYGEMVQFVKELSQVGNDKGEFMATERDMADILHKWSTKPRSVEHDSSQ